MARARNIKPGIMDNERLADCDHAARLLFIYLWMLADREGRLEDRPRRIGVQAMPYDRDIDADAMLQQLENAGFILRYEVDGERFIQIVHFKKHQSPHGKEKKSTIPAPDKVSANSGKGEGNTGNSTKPAAPDSLILRSSDSHDSLNPEEEAQPPKAPAPEAADPVFISLPLADKSEYDITERQVEEFARLYPALNIQQVLRNIVGWNQANPKNRKTRGGVLRHIHGWLAREQNRAHASPGNKTGPSLVGDRDYQSGEREFYRNEGRS